MEDDGSPKLEWVRVPSEESAKRKRRKDSPGALLLRGLIKNSRSSDVYHFSPDDIRHLKDLRRCDLELAQACEYLCEKGCTGGGKDLARFLGSMQRRWGKSKKRDIPFVSTKDHIEIMDPITGEYRELREPIDISEHYDLIDKGDLVKNYIESIEVALWNKWINDSNCVQDKKDTLVTLIKKISIELLWSVKDGIHPDSNVPHMAVNRLFELAVVDGPASISPLYQEELDNILEQMQQLVPDLTLDDIKFGDFFELMDGESTGLFNFLYVKVLAILFSTKSESDETFGSYVKVFQYLHNDRAFALVKANQNIDLVKFNEILEAAYHGTRFCLHPNLKHLLTREANALFVNELCNPEVSQSIIDKIHENIRTHAACFDKSRHPPYSTLYQAIGVGKTKYVLGMGETSILFYINSRAPFRSTIVGSISIIGSPSSAATFFLSMFDVYLKWISDPNKVDEVCRYHEYLMPEKNFFKSFSLLLADGASPVHDEFWREVEARKKQYGLDFGSLDSQGRMRRAHSEKALSDSVTTRLSEVMDAIVERASLLPGATLYNQAPKIPIIIAIDGARGLFSPKDASTSSPLCYLRDALRMFRGNGYVLFVSTSMEMVEPEDPFLTDDQFPPIIPPPALNLFPMTQLEHSKMNTDVMPANPGWAPLKYNLSECVLVGRPMFVFKFRKWSNKGSHMARMSDLRHMLEYQQRFVNYSNYIHRATMSCLLHITYEDSALNEALVSRFYAFPGEDSGDPACYLDEPLVADAFALQYNIDKAGFISELVEDFSNINGAYSPLKDGLLVAVHLLLAKLSMGFKGESDIYRETLVDRQKAPSNPCTVADFIKALYQENIPEISQELANSYVAFNALRGTSGQVDKSMLLYAWQRRIALVCNQKGQPFDILIPIVKGKQGVRYIKAKETTISSIAIKITGNHPLCETEPCSCENNCRLKDLTDIINSQTDIISVAISVAVGPSADAETKMHQVGQIPVFSLSLETLCDNLPIDDESKTKLTSIRPKSPELRTSKRICKRGSE